MGNLARETRDWAGAWACSSHTPSGLNDETGPSTFSFIDEAQLASLVKNCKSTVSKNF